MKFFDKHSQMCWHIFYWNRRMVKAYVIYKTEFFFHSLDQDTKASKNKDMFLKMNLTFLKTRVLHNAPINNVINNESSKLTLEPRCRENSLFFFHSFGSLISLHKYVLCRQTSYWQSTLMPFNTFLKQLWKLNIERLSHTWCVSIIHESECCFWPVQHCW